VRLKEDKMEDKSDMLEKMLPPREETVKKRLEKIPTKIQDKFNKLIMQETYTAKEIKFIFKCFRKYVPLAILGIVRDYVGIYRKKPKQDQKGVDKNV